MRAILIAVLWVSLSSTVAAQEDTLNDYDQLFQDHAADVFKGKDRRGAPADVLEIAGSGTLWRTGSKDLPSYDEDGTDSYLCDFSWLSMGAALVRQCGASLPPEKVARFNQYWERIARHIGDGAVPRRDLDWVRRGTTPDIGAMSGMDCRADDEVAAIVDVFSNPDVRTYWDEFLARPPKLLFLSRCD